MKKSRSVEAGLSVDVNAGAGLRFKLLTLEALIKAKEAADRKKDRAVLPLLRETLKTKKSG